MAKNRLVKNKKGQYGIYDPYTDEVTPVEGMSLVKNTRGKYGFRSGNSVIELDEVPSSLDLEQTFKKKVDTGLSSATSSTGSTSDFYKEAGVQAPALNVKDEAKAKIAEKQAEGKRFIDLFGLAELDYSGLQKYGKVGEFAADALDIPANLSQALTRGIGVGAVGAEVSGALEDGDKFDSDKVARINKENALRTGSVYLDALKKKGILQTEDLSAAGGIAEIIVESIGNMIGGYRKAAEGAVLGGSAGLAGGTIAAQVGTAIGGPIGAAVASSVTVAGSALAGMRGMVSYSTEYGSSIMESLQKNGYDVTDKKQIEEAFKNKTMIDDAREIANKRGLSIGIFDAITSGVASKVAPMAVKIAQRSAAESGKVLTKEGAKRVAGKVVFGIESVSGPLGEATAQLSTEGKIKDWDSVALEAIADLGPAAPTAAYAMYKAGQINSDLNQENLDKIEALRKSKESLSDDNEASKIALQNKISSLEAENKNRNKSMTAALQVAPVPATKRVLELTDAITDIEATLEGIKEGSRTDIDSDSRKALWDSLNDMIAERDEIRQEMLKASDDEAKVIMAPEKPMKPVVFIGDNADKIVPNNATQLSKNIPLTVSKEGTPITFSEKFKDGETAAPATAYKVSQGENNFGTIIEHTVNGEKEFVLAETGRKFSSMDDAKFALQEKLTGERVSELDRTGINRIKVEGNLANKDVFVGDPANNNKLDMESKTAIQRAVRALRSVSNANVYLYANADEYAKGIARSSGVEKVEGNLAESNAQVVDANGENSIHINLEKSGITTISHEVFHGALLGLAKKDPNAFITMRDSILNRISDSKSLSVTDESGKTRKVSAKEYLQDFQDRYSGPDFTEAERAEEFLSELAALMSLENSDVVKDKSLLDGIKLTIKNVLKKFNVEFDSLNELQDTQDMVDFFKAFNRSIKTGESINLGKVESVKGAAQPVAAETKQVEVKQVEVKAPQIAGLKTLPDGTKESEPIQIKGRRDTDYMKLSVLKNKEIVIEHMYKAGGSMFVDSGSSLMYVNMFGNEGSGNGISEDEFNSSYGINAQKLIDTYNQKVQKKYPDVSVDGLSIKAEIMKPNGDKQLLVRYSVRGKNKGFTYQDYPVEYIDVPKLKYANEFTGVSAAQAEAGAAKEIAKGGPKGKEANKSINGVISTATDEAVKLKKEGKKTVGNRKPIKDRFKRLDLINDALAIEPTTPSDMALQYFISGGKVLRGRVQDNKKNPVNPEPHSLVTLFAKKKHNIWKQDGTEMNARVQLVESNAPNISQIAHMLWESASNKVLQFDTQDLNNAVIDILTKYKSRAEMATALVQDKGTVTQQNILDGNEMLASMNEADAMAAQFYADKAGVSVEEFMQDPSKYMDEQEMIDGYNDMQTAFDILDEIQDDEAIKQYLEISTPEDLFLDELAEEVAKPEKTLEAQKAELVAEQKAKKKELADAKKKFASIKDSAQISFIDGVQKKIFPPNTGEIYNKVKDAEFYLSEIGEKLAKVESAIEFKERKTIDAFANVIEQKAEDAKPSGTPSEKLNNTEKKDVLKDTNGKPIVFNIIRKSLMGVYELGTYSDYKIIDGFEFGSATVTLSNFKRISNAAYLFGDITDEKLDSLINQAKKEGADGIIAIDYKENIQSVFVFDKSNIHEAKPRLSQFQKDEAIAMGDESVVPELSQLEKQMAGISSKDDIISLQKKMYYAEQRLKNPNITNSEKLIIENNLTAYKKAKIIKKAESLIDVNGKKYSNVQIRIADSPKSNEELFIDLSYSQNEFEENMGGVYMSEVMSKQPDKVTKKLLDFQKQNLDPLLEKAYAAQINVENINKALTLRSDREAGKTTKAEPAPAETTELNKEIKFLEDEIASYESEIENATDEIENTKYNYKEDVAALKAKKAEVRAQKMSKDAKEEALDEIDAEIEQAAEDRDDYIEGYKDTISEAKKEIKSLQRQIDKLNAKSKFQLSGEQISSFQKVDPTYKFQLGGTESSLKLIDNIRAKYNMQHTAEEMGMVKKGMRATEKLISDNVVTRVFSGANAQIYKRFSNERANKLIGKPFAMLQSYISNNVRKGLSSQNASAAKASAYSTALIQNLATTEDFQSARNKLVGGKSVAKNELWQLGKELNEMINNDKVALKRVHSLLDPEAFENITDPMLPNDKYDLSFAELRLFNVLRDMNDFIHQWHYDNGFLGEGDAGDALYQKNKGSYFPRMYNEIENKQFGDLYDALAKLPNSADFTMFKERKDFADVSESLTLKEDPIYVTTKRFGQMMQNQAILQFCDYVSKSKDYQVYSDKNKIPEGAMKAGNYRQLPYGKNGGKRYGDLTGKFVPDVVAQQLMGIEFSNQAINLTYQAAKVFDKSFVRQVLSKKITTWNPLTRAGNITMNFVFAALAGVDPITILKNRIAAKESIDNYDLDARDLDANGLLGVSMGKELQDADTEEEKAALAAAIASRTGVQIRKPKVAEAETEQAPKGIGRILTDKAIAIIKDTDQMLTDSYGKADDVAKVALFKSLVNDYGKSREEAINIVAGSMQNYNTVGKAYDYASKSVSRFVKFKADSARILFNTFKDRPLNLMATLGMFMAAQALASNLSGEDEEEREIREDRPYTNKIKIGPVNLSLTMKFGDTEINVARYLAPYSQYDAGYNTNTFKDITTYLPIQYDETTVIGVNDPMIGPLVNLAFDKDFRGMTISDPGANKFISKTVTWEESLFNRAAFLGRNYGAPYYGWAENLYAAASGNKDYYGRTRSVSEAAINAVIKVQKVDNESLQKTHESILRRLDTEYSDAAKTISHKADLIYKDISDKYEQEGISKEALEKFTAKKEAELGKFTEEQQSLMDKKVVEMQRIEQKIIKLQEIAKRKKK